MKRLLPLIMICSFAFAAWESIGPEGGSLNAIAVAPSDDDIVYTASFLSPARVFKSVDGAANWADAGSISGAVYSLAIHPTNSNIVYAGGMSFVYKTTNGGSSWSTYAFPAYTANDITIDPSNPSILYAAGSYDNGTTNVMVCAKSTNSGVTWSVTELNSYPGAARSLDVDPSNPSTIYVGGYYKDSVSAPAVYKSTNSGSTFSDITNNIPSAAMWVSALAVHETNSNIVYAATYFDGIYRSINGGSSWTKVSTGILLFCFATTPADPSVAYAGADTLIYKTTNSGASWFIPGSGYGNSHKYQRGLAVAQNSRSSLVYTCDVQGCFKSTNGGSNWSAVVHGILMAQINCLGISPSSPVILYVYDANLGIFKTTNSGTDWVELDAPESCGEMVSMAIHNTDPDVVFGCEGSG